MSENINPENIIFTNIEWLEKRKTPINSDLKYLYKNSKNANKI